jgi:hypothetical protein
MQRPGHGCPLPVIQFDWYGIALRELTQAQQPDATPEQRAALPILRERIRLHERLSAKPFVEQDLVKTLAQLSRGEELNSDTVHLGAINQEARRLLEKWQDPDRDSLHPYT